MRRRMTIGTVAALSILTLTGCGGGSESSDTSKPANPPSGVNKPMVRPRVAFVTNGVADFWTIAKAGAEDGASDYGAELTVIMPAGIEDQKKKLEDLLVRGVDGIAVSPIDPANQVEILNNAAAKAHLITHDSDAPGTDRLVYIGMDNYDAGWMCGEMARAALPDGGKVVIFIGRLEQDNARRRRQGTIDALLGRSKDPARYDEPGTVLESDDGQYTIVGTYTDQFDRAKAKANVEDALSLHPDLAAMVGLFEYNPPLCLDVLQRQNLLTKVKVIGFDENPVTLEGIRRGWVAGTVVQNPFLYGKESVRVLVALANGDRSVLPENRFIDIPARVIDTSNVDEFEADLKQKLGN